MHTEAYSKKTLRAKIAGLRSLLERGGTQKTSAPGAGGKLEPAELGSTHFFPHILELMPGVLHVYDLEEKVLVFINPKMANILGYSPEEWEAMGEGVLPNLMFPGDVPRFDRHIAHVRTLADHERANFECRMRDRSGEWRWFQSASAVFLRDDQGAVRQVISSALDITGHKKAEESLLATKKKNQFLANIIERSSQPFAVAYPDGRIGLVNAAFGRLTGYSAGELQSVNWATQLTPPEWADMEREKLEELQATGHPVRYEKEYLRKDGTRVPIELLVDQGRDSGGRVEYFYSFVSDITARKATEQALRRSERSALKHWAETEASLEAIPAHIAILDANGQILRVNKAWTSFALENGGVPESLGVGVNYLEVCNKATCEEAEEVGRFAAGIRSVLSGERYRFSMEYPCDSPQEHRWFVAYVTAAHGEGSARAVVAHVDITPQKRIEEEIRTLNHELEDRVRERTRMLQSAVDALESEIVKRQRLEREILEISEREQSRFGQDLHDGLSQELAGLSMIGGVLAKRLQAESHPSSKIAGDLAASIRSTIDSARLLAKGLYPVELNRFGLLLALEDLANRTSQRFGISCELIICGKPPQLEKSNEIHIYRIVQECIGNAIKHGRAERILIESVAFDEGHSFSVSDNGTGFEQPEASEGMGLHLMDYRARVIGGEISIEKPVQGGCRVTCRIPGTSA